MELRLIALRVLPITICQFAVLATYVDRVSLLGLPGLEYAPNLGAAWLLLGIVATSLLSLLFPSTVASVGSAAAWTMYVILVLPAWIMMYSMGREWLLPQYVSAVVIPVLVLGRLFRFECAPRPVEFSDVAQKWLAGACGLLLLMLLPAAMRNTHIDLSLASVYDRRIEFRELGGSALAYIQMSVANVLAPISIALALVTRRVQWRVIALCAVALPFVSYGSKLSLVVPCLLWLAFVVQRRYGPRPEALMTVMAVGLTSLWLIDSPTADLYGVRRVFCAPQYLSTVYIEYFEASGTLAGRDIRGVSQVFYGLPPVAPASMQVGEDVMQRPEMNANTNAFMYGFAEFGIAGAWLVLSAVAVLLKLISQACRSAPPFFGALMGLQIGSIVCEQSFHTALLSGGLIGIAVFCFCMPRVAVMK